MSLRTRTSPLPEVSKPSVRSRIPIARIPQPREDRMASTWRLAKPGRIAAALRTSQAQNSGGWFVAGASGDIGRCGCGCCVVRAHGYANVIGAYACVTKLLHSVLCLCNIIKQSYYCCHFCYLRCCTTTSSELDWKSSCMC